MKLLLDEQLAPQIARELRSRGHDVEAVIERAELVSLPDRELFVRMAVERRAIVTNNASDYIALFGETMAAGQECYGLVLTSDRSMPRSKNTIGLFVRVLDAILRTHPAEDALRNQVRWLP